MTASSSSSRAWDRAILLVLVAVWVFAMGCLAVGGHDFNSDGATAPLQASDILRGNVYLSDWSVPVDQFYTLDVALSTLLTAVAGLTPATLAAQSLFVFLVVWALAWVLAWRPDARAWITVAVLMFFLGWPTGFQRRIIFGVILHMPTMVCALLGLLALNGHYASTGGTGRKYYWLVYGLVIFWAAAGDPFIWYIAGLPFLAAGALVAWRGRNWRLWIQTGATTLMAGLAAKVVVIILQHHGFHIIDLRASLRDYVVSWNKLQFNLRLYGRSWLILFGWPTDETSPQWLLQFGGFNAKFSLLAEFLAVTRILGAVWAVVATLAVLRKPASEPVRQYIDFALLAGVMFNHASFIASSMPVDDRSSRYLLPAFFYLIILTARRLGPLFSSGLTQAPCWVRPMVFVALGGFLASAAPWLWALGHTPVNVGERELSEWLQKHKLQRGYADYWQANIVTLIAEEKVQVGQLVLSPAIRLAPEHFNSKSEWYLQPANFYICLPDDKHYHAALATFGPPREINSVGRYRIMVWDHDIQPALRDYTLTINPADLPIEAATLWQLADPGVKINELGQWVDDQPREKPAIIIYGPYAKLPAGHYRVQFVLTDTGAAPDDRVICEATIQKGDVVLSSKTFSGSDFSGTGATQTTNLVIASPGPDEPIEFRVWKSGNGKLTLLSLTLNKN